MNDPPPAWHTHGRAPLRLAAPRGEQHARRRSLEFPTAEEHEAQAKQRRHAEREQLGEPLRKLDSKGAG